MVCCIKDVHIAATDNAGGIVNRFWSFAAAAFLSACSSGVATIAADQPPPPAKSPAPEAASTASKPLVTRNPDGTITVQKLPPNGDSEGKNGLVIPPQVVTPFVRVPETKQ
jgi:hypothetical protein